MNLRKPVKIFFILVLAIQSVAAFSQTDSAHWDYISKYSQAAIAEMHYSKIPASIIMAQALHESGYGTSELAVKANNHFGIKCQTEWTGKRYTYKDDDSNTCFRLYDSVAESYRDHSDFLMSRQRYAFLFELDPADYNAWAHGLKKAGYATNPNYANILIKLIEEYKLYLLDTMQPVVEPMNSITDNPIPNSVLEAVAPEPKVFHRNRIDFFVTRPGDNIKKLTDELNLLNWEIRKYNELPKNQDVRPGQVIYLQPKRTKAQAGYTFHTAEKGESMYSISQLYGIKLKWLYKRNHMKQGTQPKAGQEIWLRGMKSGKKG
ncbi:MAG: LysM peptidoglycan-binding domain-containing protein [Porphyromonadaceae bacterium]|nr:MAG: LysM peptidoglycan-binding domain-containing protein [Porphyromonadaceae bacterium]